MLSPKLRALLSSGAAHAKWARTADRTAATAPARAAAFTALNRRLIQRFNLNPEDSDFELRLEHARKAHFKGLALKSAQVRRRKAARRA